MRNKEDYILYLVNILTLTFVSLISFKGMVISALAYILTCNMIRNR